MALTDSNGGMYMPVAPAYGGGSGWGNGFGGDGWWVILFLFALMGNGWGGFGGYGGGGFGNTVDFPWLLNGQSGINANTNAGFQNAMLNDGITSIRDNLADISTQLCGGFADVTASVNGAQTAISQQLYTNQLADLERSFNAQTATTQGLSALQAQLAQCCCDNRSATQDVKYTIAQEAGATRTANSANTQAILDKLCQLELDNYKRENDQLRSQLNMATLRESQTAQNAFIQQGFSDEVDQLYNRLSNCPVPSTPVYGRTPIFTCNNGGCGCGSAL